MGMAVESAVETAVGIAVGAAVDMVTLFDFTRLGDLDLLLLSDARERDGLRLTDRLSCWTCAGLLRLREREGEPPSARLWLCREREREGEGEMVGEPQGSRSSSGSGGRRSGKSISFRVRLGQMGF